MYINYIKSNDAYIPAKRLVVKRHEEKVERLKPTEIADYAISYYGLEDTERQTIAQRIRRYIQSEMDGKEPNEQQARAMVEYGGELSGYFLQKSSRTTKAEYSRLMKLAGEMIDSRHEYLGSPEYVSDMMDTGAACDAPSINVTEDTIKTVQAMLGLVIEKLYSGMAFDTGAYMRDLYEERNGFPNSESDKEQLARRLAIAERLEDPSSYLKPIQ